MLTKVADPHQQRLTKSPNPQNDSILKSQNAGDGTSISFAPPKIKFYISVNMKTQHFIFATQNRYKNIACTKFRAGRAGGIPDPDFEIAIAR